jgi:hypothetical protein
MKCGGRGGGDIHNPDWRATGDRIVPSSGRFSVERRLTSPEQEIAEIFTKSPKIIHISA